MYHTRHHNRIFSPFLKSSRGDYSDEKNSTAVTGRAVCVCVCVWRGGVGGGGGGGGGGGTDTDARSEKIEDNPITFPNGSVILFFFFLFVEHAHAGGRTEFIYPKPFTGETCQGENDAMCARLNTQP